MRSSKLLLLRLCCQPIRPSLQPRPGIENHENSTTFAGKKGEAHMHEARGGGFMQKECYTVHVMFSKEITHVQKSRIVNRAS